MDRATENQGKKPLEQVVADKVSEQVEKVGQGEFAARAGMAQSTISRVINLRQQVTLKRLEKLAKACGVQPYEMLIDSENMRRAVVERYLQPQIPAPAAPAPESLPGSRKGEGVGERAITDVALKPAKEKRTPPTARVEKFPNRREGTRRVRRKRQ